jgi:hypothetical protein
MIHQKMEGFQAALWESLQQQEPPQGEEWLGLKVDGLGKADGPRVPLLHAPSSDVLQQSRVVQSLRRSQILGRRHHSTLLVG